MSEGKWDSVYNKDEMVDRYEKRSQIISMKREGLDSTIIKMFPKSKNENIRVLELGSGMGHLTEKIFKAFPQAIITCVDGSFKMLNYAKDKLQKYNNQISYILKDFEDSSWLKSQSKYNVVVSARAIHHIPYDKQQELFKQIYSLLEKEGIFINGDMVKSKFKKFNFKYYDEVWAEHIQNKTKEILGKHRTIEDVRKRMYAALEKEGDNPSTVEDQLKWLSEAGFKAVDCVWKYYHIAVIVGLK